MTTKDEALKLALEALEWNLPVVEDWGMPNQIKMQHKATAAIYEALAERCVCGEPDTPGTHRTDGPCLAEQPAQQQEHVAMKFKIYKPTVPDPVRQDFNNALLPWVYDQDRSSGFDASMWVTPVATLPPQRTWVGLTDEEANELWESTDSDWELMKRTEAKLKEKNT